MYKTAALKFSYTLLPLLLSATCIIFSGALTSDAKAFAHPTSQQASTQRQARTRRRSVRKRQLRAPEVGYVPTPTETVKEMLRLAQIKPGDVLYDLGSGDGRIPIAAAERHRIRAVGIEINPELVRLAHRRAQEAGVADRVRFINEDIFRFDMREATIVTLYLLPELNLRLRPKLLRELKPGTRIISHDFDMGDWEPEQTVRVPWRNLYRTLYVWTVPRGGRIVTK